MNMPLGAAMFMTGEYIERQYVCGRCIRVSEIALRISLELFHAAGRAKVEILAVVRGFVLRAGRVDGHAAHRIARLGAVAACRMLVRRVFVQQGVVAAMLLFVHASLAPRFFVIDLTTTTQRHYAKQPTARLP